MNSILKIILVVTLLMF